MFRFFGFITSAYGSRLLSMFYEKKKKDVGKNTCEGLSPSSTMEATSAAAPTPVV
jgi:hypothetical protein